MRRCKHHRGTLLQRCPEAGGRSAGRGAQSDGWMMDGRMDKSHKGIFWRVLKIIRDSSWRNSRTGDGVANSTSCSVGSSALALESLILSAFTPLPHTLLPPLPCSLLLRRIGVYSRQSTPVQEVEREGLREMRDHGRTSEGENRITIVLGLLSDLTEGVWGL